MTCEEFEELAGADALDAVSAEEHTLLEEHLKTCLRCRQLARELQSITELLPLAVPAREPSLGLKERVMTAIEAETSPRPIMLQPDQKKRPRNTRKLPWFTSLIAAAAICLLALSSGITAWNISLQQQLAAANAQVAHTYEIRGTTTTPGASGQLAYLPEQHATILTVRGLPDASGGQVYQGWLLHCKKPVSMGLFNQVNGVASITYPGDIRSYEVAAISLEPGPGASPGGPKGQIVAEGTLNTEAQSACHG
jgi:anti-sigma-K factor RskA